MPRWSASAGLLQGPLEGMEWLIALIVLVPLGLAAVVLWANAAGRRRRRHELNELIADVEAVRTGEARPVDRVVADEELAGLHDAVGRLWHDVAQTRRQATVANDRLDAVIHASADTAVFSTDGDGDLRFVGPGAAELFGWEVDQLQGRPASVLFEENAYDTLLAHLTSSRLSDDGLIERTRMVRQTGEVFPAEVRLRALRQAGDSGLGLAFVVRDLSRDERMEERLRHSEQRYEGLVEDLADPVAIVRGGELRYVNPAFSRRWEEGGKVGASFRDLVSTRDVLRVEEALDQLENAGGHRHLTLSLRVDRSGWADFEGTARAVRFEGGSAVLLVLRDETLHRRLIARLRRHATQLDSILEATTDGILVVTDEGGGRRVQMTNQAFSRLTGVPTDRLLGATESEVAAELSVAGPGMTELGAWLDGAEDGDLALAEIGDPPRDLEARAFVLMDADGGQEIGRVIVCRDLTLQRRSERELQQYADQLQLSKTELSRAYAELDEAHRDAKERNLELDRLNAELRRLDELKSQLLGNVSHELQTPLVSVRGYTEMILKGRLGPVNEEQRKGLSLSLKNVDRLIGMIDSLLSFSRNDGDLARPHLTRLRLADLAEEARQTVANDLEAKRLRFELEIGDAIEIEADRDGVLRVLLNLVGNAVKFTRTGGRILVAARPAGEGWVECRVEDDGVGIPAERIDRIWDRGESVLPDGVQAPPGSGLGLSIVQQVLRQHGASIRVDSRPGEGTRFTFRLPAPVEASVAAPSDTARDASAPAGDAPEPIPSTPAARITIDVPDAGVPEVVPDSPPGPSSATEPAVEPDSVSGATPAGPTEDVPGSAAGAGANRGGAATDADSPGTPDPPETATRETETPAPRFRVIRKPVDRS